MAVADAELGSDLPRVRAAQVGGDDLLLPVAAVAMGKGWGVAHRTIPIISQARWAPYWSRK